MNEYETRRFEKIKKNEALLAELDIKPVVPHKRQADRNRSSKKRKLVEAIAPSRVSARIAAAPTKPTYSEDEINKSVSLSRKSAQRSKSTSAPEEAGLPVDEAERWIPAENIEEIQAGWREWKVTGSPPTRDGSMVFHFEDYADFTPNKSPEEMLREGCFGGSYYRPLQSRKLGVIIKDDWNELPEEWISGLPIEKYLTSLTYDPDVNKFKVSCGQSIEEWEAAGWIDHHHDIRGWFQWYTRFFQGRRCDDDPRQVSRWRKCVGETGRWRRMLLKKYMQLGVRYVFDDGEDEREVSPVMHQTCHHWAFEVRQEHLDAYWASGG